MSTALAAEDHAAREAALDPGASVILQAPAGSGKTTVLTQRLLRLLCEVDEPEQIIAITFTRKAAGEMGARVLRALRDTASAAEPGTQQQRRLRELAAAVRARSHERGWGLLESPARLRIQTIDSLNRALALRMPIGARGAGSLAVMEEAEQAYAEAARRTLLDAQDEPGYRDAAELLLSRLENDFGRCETLIREMLAARSHWLPHLLGGGASPDLQQRVQQSLQAIVAERLRDAQAWLPAAVIAEGAAVVREAALRHRAGDPAALAPWRDPAGAVEPGAAAAGGSLTLAQWQALARTALTQSGSLRVSLTQREGFPATDRPLKARALQWLSDLAGVPQAGALLQELLLLPPPQLPADEAAALAALARVLTLAASELNLVFGERGEVDFAHVAAAARAALVQESAPTDLALRLDAEVRHILVDEFQDTSIEQYALLCALTAGWQAGDGRTLFLVGDPMQSIYQFREAEVGLFLRARDHGLGGLPLTPLALRCNFRSQPGLVDWFNAVFARCFPDRDDARASAVRYAASQAGGNDTAAGAVHLYRIAAGDRAAESRRLAALVGELRRADPDASIAILVTARAHATALVAALEAEGIAVAGVDLVPLGELSIVRDLAALARALDHLGDRTAWLAVLRAPWCGLTLADLSALAGDGRELTLWEAMGQDSRQAGLSADGRARLLRVRAVLAGVLSEPDRDLAWRVEAAWLRLGGPSAAAPAELVHAQTFFQALGRWAAPGQAEAALDLQLQRGLARLYAAHREVPGERAVQVMTIHRAKGLEFDHVLLPGLGRRGRPDREPLLRWLELPRDARGVSTDLLMAPIGTPGERASPLGQFIRSLQSRRSANERSRLLYVAATRARRSLHLFGELLGRGGTEPAAGSPLATLWPALAAQFLAANEIGGATAVAAAAPALRRLRADFLMPVPPAGPEARGFAIASYEPAPRAGTDAGIGAGIGAGIDTGIDTGTSGAARLACETLRGWARQGRLPAAVPTAPELATRAAAFGMEEPLPVEMVEGAVRLLHACLADPRLQWLFAQRQDREAPLALTGLFEGRLTGMSADLCFVDGGVRWVVDFTCAPEAPPLDKYRALAAGAGLGAVRVARYDPQRCAFEEL